MEEEVEEEYAMSMQKFFWTLVRGNLATKLLPSSSSLAAAMAAASTNEKKNEKKNLIKIANN